MIISRKQQIIFCVGYYRYSFLSIGIACVFQPIQINWVISAKKGARLYKQHGKCNTEFTVGGFEATVRIFFLSKTKMPVQFRF
jgi:hypothetical protein